MSVKEQISGLPMGELIGAPLRAAADANLHLAQTTAEFNKNVGPDGEGKSGTAAFGCPQRTENKDEQK